jgi:hypothetical protein
MLDPSQRIQITMSMVSTILRKHHQSVDVINELRVLLMKIVPLPILPFHQAVVALRGSATIGLHLPMTLPYNSRSNKCIVSMVGKAVLPSILNGFSIHVVYIRMLEW